MYMKNSTAAENSNICVIYAKWEHCLGKTVRKENQPIGDLLPWMQCVVHVLKLTQLKVKSHILTSEPERWRRTICMQNWVIILNYKSCFWMFNQTVLFSEDLCIILCAIIMVFVWYSATMYDELPNKRLTLVVVIVQFMFLESEWGEIVFRCSSP